MRRRSPVGIERRNAHGRERWPVRHVERVPDLRRRLGHAALFRLDRIGPMQFWLSSRREPRTATLKSSGLDWPLAYPVTLTNRPASNKTEASRLEDTSRLKGMPRISRADV